MLAGIATAVVVLKLWAVGAPGGFEEEETKDMYINWRTTSRTWLGTRRSRRRRSRSSPRRTRSQRKIHYKLEYDFTTQELKVTVIECSDLPPTDWSTGLTDLC